MLIVDRKLHLLLLFNFHTQGHCTPWTNLGGFVSFTPILKNCPELGLFCPKHGSGCTKGLQQRLCELVLDSPPPATIVWFAQCTCRASLQVANCFRPTMSFIFWYGCSVKKLVGYVASSPVSSMQRLMCGAVACILPLPFLSEGCEDVLFQLALRMAVPLVLKAPLSEGALSECLNCCLRSIHDCINSGLLCPPATAL